MSDNNNKLIIDDNFIKLFDLKTPEKILERTFNQNSSKNFHENILLTKNEFKSIEELKSALKDENYYIIESKPVDSTNNSNCCSIFQKFTAKSSDENTAYFDKSFRNSTYIDMFFNTLPNVVLGQLTPFLKVSFLLPEINKGVKTDINSMISLQNYVGDTDKQNLENFNNLFTIDFSNENSINSNTSLGGSGDNFYFRQALPKDGKYFLTDESLYTSPPHLSPNFRPLMSISKLSVRVIPTVDFNVSFDEYNLSLVIHDKTMLNKFKYLIGVEYRDMISAVIEYGWSYPDYDYENIYSHFFNRILRKKVYCKLVNLSYNFDEVGQVKLEMKLMTKGADHLIVLNALENAGKYTESVQKLKELKNSLGEWLNTYKISPNIRDGILLSRLTDESADVITEEQSTKIDELIKVLLNSKNPNSNNVLIDDAGKAKLNDSIKGLKDFLLNDKSTKTNKLKQSYNKFIDDIVKNFSLWVSNYRKTNPNYYGENIIDSENFYFHEIITYFVSETISKKDKNLGISEVQSIYYNFNKNIPERMAGKSIGDFKINKNEFGNVLKMAEKKLTLEQFIGFILNNFLNKIESSGYGFVEGLDNIYKKDGTVDSQKQKSNKEKIEKAVKDREDSGFKVIPPKVSFRVENLNKIMRIHIYDITNRIIFKANANEIGQLDHIKKMFDEWKEKQTDTLKGQVSSKAEEILSNQNRKSFSYIKQIFSDHYPILNLDGASSSVLKSFSISNSMDSATTTHLINKMYDNVKKDKLAEENFYTRIVPGKITMESLGFPLAEVHQMFFIDANTGTDIDNLYNVSSISHNIEPGGFKTTYELSSADSYGAHENIYREINRIKNIVEGKQVEITTQEIPKKGKNGQQIPSKGDQKAEEIEALRKKANSTQAQAQAARGSSTSTNTQSASNTGTSSNPTSSTSSTSSASSSNTSSLTSSRGPGPWAPNT